MARPTSFRLEEQLLNRLGHAAKAASISVTSLVSTLIDEGLKTRRFPGIVYRDGETGRRAGVVGGPDVWEIVRAVKETPGKGDARVRRLVEELGLSRDRVGLAVDFYTAFPTEIDERIAADEAAAERTQEMIARRERLMA
jgi:hypothetical protein